MRWVFAGFFGVIVLIIATMGWRGMTSERRPLMLVPDMDIQPRYDAQAESAFFTDGRTMRPTPAGVVAYAGPDYFSDAGSPRLNVDLLAEDDAYYRGKAGKEFVAKMPVKVDLALLRRGRERFNINCAVCHGATGAGNGITTQYGLVGVPTYHDQRLRSMPDGEIFNTITNGKNSMTAYGHQVEYRDRWAIVAYIRTLQRSQNATEADVPASALGEMNP
jgi:mono/diheme cytochrome c family protein